MITEDKKYFVIDNFFSPTEYRILKKFFTDPDFDWGYIANVEFGEDVFNQKELLNYGFTSTLYNSDRGRQVNKNPIITDMFVFNTQRLFDVKNLLRIRVGLQTPLGKKYVHAPHVDFQEPHYTGLFYFSTERGSGETHIYDTCHDPYKDDMQSHPANMKSIDTVEAVENRVLFFRGDVYHSSSAPEKIKRRIAVNVNFEGKPRDANPNKQKTVQQ